MTHLERLPGRPHQSHFARIARLTWPGVRKDADRKRWAFWTGVDAALALYVDQAELEPRVVTGIRELDALRVHAMIRDQEEDVLVKRRRGGGVFDSYLDWFDEYGSGKTPELPATVLYEGEIHERAL